MYNIKIYNIKNIKSVVKNKKQKQNKKKSVFLSWGGESRGQKRGKVPNFQQIPSPIVSQMPGCQTITHVRKNILG